MSTSAAASRPSGAPEVGPEAAATAGGIGGGGGTAGIGTLEFAGGGGACVDGATEGVGGGGRDSGGEDCGDGGGGMAATPHVPLGCVMLSWRPPQVEATSGARPARPDGTALEMTDVTVASQRQLAALKVPNPEQQPWRVAPPRLLAAAVAEAEPSSTLCRAVRHGARVPSSCSASCRQEVAPVGRAPSSTNSDATATEGCMVGGGAITPPLEATATAYSDSYARWPSHDACLDRSMHCCVLVLENNMSRPFVETMTGAVGCPLEDIDELLKTHVRGACLNPLAVALLTACAVRVQGAAVGELRTALGPDLPSSWDDIWLLRFVLSFEDLARRGADVAVRCRGGVSALCCVGTRLEHRPFASTPRVDTR